MTPKVLSNYTFDVRINTTIAVDAYSEAEAEKAAEDQLENCELINHLTGDTFDLDLEDGLVLIDTDEPDEENVK